MIEAKGKRLEQKDLLAFCNELCAELGGGKDGLKFGKDKNGNYWIFGINISELKINSEKENENGSASG